MDPFLDTDDQGDGNDAQLRKSLMISSDKRGGQFNSASSVCSDRTLAGTALSLSTVSMVVGLCALFIKMPPPAKPATTAGGMVWNGVDSFNAFTVNWEAKNKEAWEAAVTDDIDMYV